MLSPLQYLNFAGVPLLIGVSAILLVGWLGATLIKSPISRQRFGEMSLLASVIWLLLPLVPGLNALGGRSSVSPGSFDHDPPVQWARAADDMSARGPMPAAATAPDANSQGAVSQPPLTFREARSSLAQRGPLVHELGDPGPQANERPSSDVRRVGQLPADHPGLQSRAGELPPIGFSAPSPGWGEFWAGRSALLAKIYLGGALLALIWLALGHVHLMRWVRAARAVAPWVQALVPRGHGKVPRILSSDRCRRVMTFGFFQPTIMLPQRLLVRQNISQLRHVLLHELGHIHQRDARGQCLLNVALVCLYFHPLYWMLRRRICFARELVIDDWAAQRSIKSHYVTDMIALAKQPTRAPRGPALAVEAIRYPHTEFYRRIKMLVQRTTPLETRRPRGAWLLQNSIVVFVLISLVAMVGVPSAPAQDPTLRNPDKLIASLRAERAQLKQQVSEYQQRVGQLENALARIENRLAKALDESQARQKQSSDLMQAEMEKKLAQAMNQLASQDAIIRALESRIQKGVNDQKMAERAEPKPSLDLPEAGESASTRAAVVTGSKAAPSVHSDLIQLAGSYADALAERDISAVEIKQIAELVSRNEASSFQLEIAKIRHDSTRRKTDMLRQIAEAKLQSLKVELDQALQILQRSQQLVDKGFVPQSQLAVEQAAIIQVETKIDILQRILRND